MLKKLLIVLFGLLVVFRLMMPGENQTLPVVAMDEAVPAFKVPGIREGFVLTEAGLPDKAILSFVSSSCGHCQRQHRLLGRQESLPAPVYLLFLEEEPTSVAEWLDAQGVRYYEEAAIADVPTMDAFEVYYTPVNFVVRNGRLIKRFNGALNDEKLRMISGDLGL